MKRLVSKEKLKMAKLLVEKNGADLVDDIVLKNLKLGQLEDIEDTLLKNCFYGYVVDHGIQKLKFVRIYQGHDYELDIRIEFELVSGLGNVFYNIFDYGKTWALTKEELL